MIRCIGARRRLALTMVAVAGVARGALLPTPLAAQGAPIPQVTLSGVRTVRSLQQWPGISLQVDRDAYVAVFAVTRGRRDVPVQVLSPASPRDKGFVKGGRSLPVRALDNGEMLHLVNWGEAPVIIAFASRTPPLLSPFAAGRRWSRTAVLDTAVLDDQELIDVLGQGLFGPNGQYDVFLATASAATPLTPYADIWAFDDECLGYSNRWTRRFGIDGYGLYRWNSIDPFVRGFPMGLAMGLPIGLPLGLPFDIGYAGWIPGMSAAYVNGQRLAVGSTSVLQAGLPCSAFRVAWWPAGMTWPGMPHDSALAPPVDGTSAGFTSPVPRLPQYPRPGRGLELADPDGPRQPAPPGDRTPAATWRDAREFSPRFPGVSAQPRPWTTGVERWAGEQRNGTFDPSRAGVTARQEAGRQERIRQEAGYGSVGGSNGSASVSADGPSRRPDLPNPRSQPAGDAGVSRSTGTLDSKPQAQGSKDPPAPAPPSTPPSTPPAAPPPSRPPPPR